MSDYITRERNLTLLTDYYEYTMVNGYFHAGIQEKIAVFDVFFRRVPENGGFAIYAGLQQIIELINGLSFTEEDIEYFRKKGCFSEKFFNFLRNFKFRCDVWSIKEGTPIFPNEPIITVRGPLEQVQMVETMLLVTFNFETLIATKASRLIRAAQGRAIVEFGSRRAQGYDGAMLGARAAYIAGCAGTACTISDRMMGVPASGTMAHSWVQAFENEYEAFKAYAETYPDNCCLLVDTYNVLKSGVPNAIRVFNEVVLPKGFRPKSIRLDSGDLAYLSKKARKMLDDAGFPDVKIMASNSLDEYIIRIDFDPNKDEDTMKKINEGNAYTLSTGDMVFVCNGVEKRLPGSSMYNTYTDSDGNTTGEDFVGENLITSKNEPVFGGVYKLVAIENDNGELIPKIKLSETAQKITTPGFKEVYRFYGRDNGKALADYIVLAGEEVDDTKPITIFDPNDIWKKKTLTNFRAEKLQVQIFKKGVQCYTAPSLEEIRSYSAAQMDTLWDEIKRFEYPHTYYVDLSQKLWETKQRLMEEMNQQ